MGPSVGIATTPTASYRGGDAFIPKLQNPVSAIFLPLSPRKSRPEGAIAINRIPSYQLGLWGLGLDLEVSAVRSYS